MRNNRVVLVTGASGFVGRHLVEYLAEREYNVIASSRSFFKFRHPNITNVQLPDLTSDFDWRSLLYQCDTVVHLAGLAHRFASDDLYDLINVQAVASLTQAAKDCGTRQLVYVSSIAAQSGSYSDVNLTEADAPRPTNAYGRSKLAAENIVRAADIPFTILRPVVMYGLEDKGNFALMRKCARLPIPLPFGSLKAPRSVLSISNFSSAVDFVLKDVRSIGETFIVSDPSAVSVAEMIAECRTALGKRPHLIQIPEKWIETILKFFGQEGMWQRIGCRLLAPPHKLLQRGWTPERNSFLIQEN
ncbi:NAD-dependent epimerase/dehydratase family protein [Bradyrhizobium ottawaense]|uniref:NAD-dependent epimerase/dehydratase family protein n=1 Tax=Bradyrhizobium ottawaense TaxID=931866 RepID=UPI002AE046E3|nr:NAD-dependent epimerase/dehydratase family protein [Bradyrhizobium ottawaense]WQN81240.1 NAD-dependent epimerase/dehydratase family protein [Bradyrhizobium ottawaense]